MEKTAHLSNKTNWLAFNLNFNCDSKTSHAVQHTSQARYQAKEYSTQHTMENTAVLSHDTAHKETSFALYTLRIKPIITSWYEVLNFSCGLDLLWKIKMTDFIRQTLRTQHVIRKTRRKANKHAAQHTTSDVFLFGTKNRWRKQYHTTYMHNHWLRRRVSNWVNGYESMRHSVQWHNTPRYHQDGKCGNLELQA